MKSEGFNVEVVLKQRLVGAAVIIALGIIVIPIILNGAGERQLRKMPAAPEPGQTLKPGFIIKNKQEIKLPAESATVMIAPQPDSDPDTGPVVLVKPEKTIAVKTPKTRPEKKPVKPVKKPEQITVKKAKKVDSKPAAIVKPQRKIATNTKSTSQVSSWVVQVGSFTDSKKAFGLRDDLRKKHYKAFVEKVSGRTGQRMYRVRVGPVVKRTQADTLSIKLKTEGVKSFITRYP